MEVQSRVVTSSRLPGGDLNLGLLRLDMLTSFLHLPQTARHWAPWGRGVGGSTDGFSTPSPALDTSHEPQP